MPGLTSETVPKNAFEKRKERAQRQAVARRKSDDDSSDDGQEISPTSLAQLASTSLRGTVNLSESMNLPLFANSRAKHANQVVCYQQKNPSNSPALSTASTSRPTGVSHTPSFGSEGISSEPPSPRTPCP